MKRLLPLLLIALLALSTSSLKAQIIKEDAKFLIYVDDIGLPRYVVAIERVEKLKDNTYLFAGMDTLIEEGEKIYHIRKKDTILSYDYSLEAGDTFVFFRLSKPDSMIVDSVIQKEFYDGNMYKHWYLNGALGNIVWVEGFGAETYGWLDYVYYFTEAPIIKGICVKEEIVFWDNRISTSDPEIESPTCNFDSLLVLNSIPELTNAINLYPNPATNLVRIEDFTDIQSVKVYDLLGKQRKATWNGADRLDISTLQDGNYIVTIKYHTGQKAYSRLIKE